MKEQNIEKLFKDSFSNFEADVNPSAWANIEQNLPASPQNIPGNSPVAKPAGFFGKISLNTALLVTGISAALIGTGIYFSSFKPSTQDNLVQNVQSATQPAKDNSPVLSGGGSVASHNNAPVSESKNAAAEKQTPSVAKEKAYLNNQQQQPVTETKTENVSNSNSNSNSNSVQVSMEANTSPESVTEQKTTGGITTKLSHVVVQSTQQDAAKNNSSPNSGDPSSATAGHLNTASASTEEEGISPEEYTDEFHFFIPNVFTPNGDGVNDFFQPVANVSLFKDYEMVIYDRYGSELFKSHDVDFPWDGKLRNGSEAAFAVYVYKIKLTDFKGEAHDYIGYVALFN